MDYKDYKVKEQVATSFDVDTAPAGPLAISSPAMQMAEWELETSNSMKVEQEVNCDCEGEFDKEFPAIAEAVAERLSFERKRSWLFQRVAGATALATGVVAVTALAFVAVAGASQAYRTLSHGSGLIHSWDLKNEGWVDTTPEWMKEKPAEDKGCMLKAPPEEGSDCLH